MIETYVEVDIDKIIKNINNIQSINEESMFCAVIKANGYGLGAVRIAREIEEFVDYFAVARLEEAISLRKSGITKPVMVLAYVNFEEIDKCVKYDIDLPIYDLEYAKKINDSISGKLKVHIALDTGHGRIGFRESELDDIKKLKNLDNLDVISAFSHFSTADEKDTSFTMIQKERFYNILNQIKDYYKFKFIHLANSAGAIKHNITKDMMRIGISLYGIYPSIEVKNEKLIDLEQCFKYISHVSYVKDIPANTPISYGRTFISKEPMKIATIPLGYADGYMRAFSNKGEVLINNKLCKVLGLVCMDQLMVDVSGMEVYMDDEVIIYPNIYKESNKINTIPYELMTSIAMRVPRIYKKNGKIIDIDNYLGEIYED